MKADARWQDYLKTLTELQPTMFKSTSQIFGLLVAEEADVAIIGLAHDVLRERSLCTPVDYQPLSPVVSNLSCMALAKLAPTRTLVDCSSSS